MRTVVLVAVSVSIGAVIGWQARSFLEEPVRPSASFTFNDRLADAQVPYLSATGMWRGADLANKVNTVRIVCDGTDRTCDMQQADVMSVGSTPFLSLYNQSFKVTQLDANGLTAVELLPSLCIRQTLLIDRQAQAVSLVRTKINREDKCAVVQDEPVTISLVDGVKGRL
jgi:hypothetical protein